MIRETAQSVVEALGLEKKDDIVEGLATRWQRGNLILQSADTSLQSKEVPLETFFHKIVMIRNNLRVLEQKVNASDKLTDADKVDLQQYITRCYGSLTTFNVLFKNKEDQVLDRRVTSLGREWERRQTAFYTQPCGVRFPTCVRWHPRPPRPDMEQNPPFPSPEELKSKALRVHEIEFRRQGFLRHFYAAGNGRGGRRREAGENRGRRTSISDFLPRDIKAHLDRFVIQQDEAKKVLAIAVCDHYNHVNYLRHLEKEDAVRAEETEYAKQNVILVGPTGVGKTYLIKHIAELIKVPFVKADATLSSARRAMSAAMSKIWSAS